MIHARKDYDRIQDPAGIIPADEPVFLLRGRDICAPGTIRAWAQLARLAGADATIVEAAERQADLMEQYQAACEKQVPDMPAEARRFMAMES